VPLPGNSSAACRRSTASKVQTLKLAGNNVPTCINLIWQFGVPSSLLNSSASYRRRPYNESPRVLAEDTGYTAAVADDASISSFRPSNVAMNTCVAILT
jgi:hypothetical protein